MPTQINSKDSTVKALPAIITGVQLSEEYFLAIDAEEPVCAEITTEVTAQMTWDDLAVTNNVSKNCDPAPSGKVTSQ
jgi:hypothetical protein